ncbi:MAG: aspartate--tRNA ligase [Candidatus Aenigmarchaeota archaeon]|nr:aspartate--tRNA ligase [Candidatus Aenigmarchaeota archaeon]
MQKTNIDQLNNLVNQKATLMGWVQSRRNLGKIVFLNLRDAFGNVQVVLSLKELDDQSIKQLEKIRNEFVISVEGVVRLRQGKEKKDNLTINDVEIQAEQIKVLAESITPPFDLNNEQQQVKEESRFKYRYLDLRRSCLHHNLMLRHQVVTAMRQFFNQRQFLEIETPILTKGTPEGAREYVVPARLFPGKAYVLPQSPQQFKQLLMIAGFERYYQLARCFRDEDTRGDRQPEFTQFDLEMSFVEQEDILQLIEQMFVQLIEQINSLSNLSKKITKTPFSHLTYAQAMEKYQTDKPDLRQDKNNPNELAFTWITEIPLFQYSEEEKKIVAGHHPFTMPDQRDLDLLDKDPLKVRSLSYDLVLNGYEIGGGSVRINQPALQQNIFQILRLSNKDIQERFGHLLTALSYGAPPHGGIALGIDRLIMILANQPNIREVIAFPKTTDGRDLMVGAPAEIEHKIIK